MTRSRKKSPFVAIHLLRKIEKLKTKEEKEIIKTWFRASTIIPAMVGYIIAIHNGKEHYRSIRSMMGSLEGTSRQSSANTDFFGFPTPFPLYLY